MGGLGKTFKSKGILGLSVMGDLNAKVGNVPVECIIEGQRARRTEAVNTCEVVCKKRTGDRE